MPERLFVPEILGYQQTLGMVRELARLFGTSLIATALRLVRFGEDDSLLIWSRLGRRWKWFYRSPRMPTAVWPLDQPGRDSIAYRLLRGERSDSGSQLVKWHQWLDLSCMKAQTWHYIREDSVRMRNGDVLSLLWFDDENAMDALMDWEPHHRWKLVGDRG